MGFSYCLVSLVLVYCVIEVISICYSFPLTVLLSILLSVILLVSVRNYIFNRMNMWENLLLYEIIVFFSSRPWLWSLALNLYLLAPSLNLFLPDLTLNLCLPVPEFTVKVCSGYNIYLHKFQCLLIYAYFLSIMWEISKLFEVSLQEIFLSFLIGYNWSHSVHFHFVIPLLQLFYINMMLICEKKKKIIKKNILLT